MSKERFTRFGVYGVILDGSRLLLTRKKGGPFKGLWDFPGGGIEFGETFEQTLKRELLEEAALSGDKFELLGTVSSAGEYKDGEKHYQYHLLGVVYRIGLHEKRLDLVPEEEGRWVSLHDIQLNEVTPFVQQILPMILV